MTEVKIQTCPNEAIRVYHMKAQLTEDGITHKGPVAELVGKLPGVTDVFVKRYSIQVTKGEAWMKLSRGFWSSWARFGRRHEAKA